MQALNEPTAMPTLFMPLSLGRAPGITNESRIAPGVGTLHYVVRTATPPDELVPSVRRGDQARSIRTWPSRVQHAAGAWSIAHRRR